MFNDKMALAIADAAATASIPEAGMLAIVEVETAGSPLEADGRTPTFLFERHIFYRELNARQPHKLAQAIKLGLAIPHWSKATQYKDERTSQMRLELLSRAKAVDEDCALRSCSWGLPQIMGNECAEVGFPNAKAMVDYMISGGVPAHIQLMIRFLKARNLVSAIERKDFGYVALRYNGSGYRQNQYDTRLASADKKWERKLQTLRAAPVAAPHPEESLSRDEIEQIQIKLRQLGYHEIGATDGRWGDKTSAGIFAFQKQEGLPTTGHYDDATKAALGEADPRPVPTERADATLDDLREGGSTTIASADTASTIGKIKVIGGSAIGIGAATEQATTILTGTQDAVDKVGQAKTLWGSIHDLLHPVIGHPVIIVLAIVLVVGGYFVIHYANKIKLSRLSDHQDGTHAGTLED